MVGFKRLGHSPFWSSSQLLNSYRFSSSSSLFVLALRLTAVSGSSFAQQPHADHAATTPAVPPRLSFQTLLLAGIVRFGAFSNTAARAIIEWAKSPSTKNEMGSAAGAWFEPTRNRRGMYSGVLVFSNFTFHLAAGI